MAHTSFIRKKRYNSLILFLQMFTLSVWIKIETIYLSKENVDRHFGRHQFLQFLTGYFLMFEMRATISIPFQMENILKMKTRARHGNIDGYLYYLLDNRKRWPSPSRPAIYSSDYTTRKNKNLLLFYYYYFLLYLEVSYRTASLFNSIWFIIFCHWRHRWTSLKLCHSSNHHCTRIGGGRIRARHLYSK